MAWVSAGCGFEAPAREFQNTKTAAQIRDTRLDESSGVAPSRRYPGWFYTHNDDGEALQFWRFDLAGKLQGPYTVPGVANRDVEDMASAQFEGESRLYFADIGDNSAHYPSVRVYRCAEPNAQGSVGRVETFDIRYPDGPRNAEAFFVAPKSGDFWLIEKVSSRAAGIYRLRSPRPGASTWERVGELSLEGGFAAARLATGAALSPDGRYVAVRTYLTAYEFAAGPNLDHWWKQSPSRIPLNIEAQGEAIGYSLDGKTLVTTSEGTPCQVSTIQAIEP